MAQIDQLVPHLHHLPHDEAPRSQRMIGSNRAPIDPGSRLIIHYTYKALLKTCIISLLSY